MKKITVLDLFSGIGGFHLGFEKAGYDVKTFFSEVDAHAIAVYKYNFKNSKYVGSVTDVRGEQLPKIDAITFGSPCQDFSVAGNRKGMEGDRSSLILEAIRLIDECRPGVFIWENVKGTFSSNDGRDFAAILQAFTNIGGYRLEWQLCNTSWFLPQNRERIYLVGYSTEPKGDWKGVFPIQKNDKVSTGEERTMGSTPGHSRTITARYWKMGSGDTYVKMADYRNDEGLRVREDDESPCLSARRHSEKDVSTMPPLAVSGALRTYPRQKPKGEEDNRKKQLETRSDDVSNAVTTHPFDSVVVPTQLGNSEKYGNSVKSEGDDAFTLRSSEPNGVIENKSIRRLTPIECERLQGFPDNWTQYGIYNGETKEVSNTQRYKMCGNAVTVDVVEAVVNQCKDII
jgi:DNA (cytosine-5)-methyltransferase 1